MEQSCPAKLSLQETPSSSGGTQAKMELSDQVFPWTREGFLWFLDRNGGTIMQISTNVSVETRMSEPSLDQPTPASL